MPKRGRSSPGTETSAPQRASIVVAGDCGGAQEWARLQASVTTTEALTQSAIEAALPYACKRSGLRSIGSHVLRHTFCSHLAMRGAAPKAAQELAGHSTLSMTLRYMHLAPSALREAIGLLDLGHQVGNAPDLSTGTD